MKNIFYLLIILAIVISLLSLFFSLPVMLKPVKDEPKVEQNKPIIYEEYNGKG